MRVVLSHDFAKSHDRAAAVIAHDHASGIVVPFVSRYPQRTPYREQAASIAQCLAQLKQDFPQAQIAFVCDGSGVGAAAFELVQAQAVTGVSYYAVSWTGGQRVARGRELWQVSVPKTHLIRATQAALGAGRLHLPATVEGTALRRELLNYELHITKRGWTAAARGVGHDDLVCALLMGVWALDDA